MATIQDLRATVTADLTVAGRPELNVTVKATVGVGLLGDQLIMTLGAAELQLSAAEQTALAQAFRHIRTQAIAAVKVACTLA